VAAAVLGGQLLLLAARAPDSDDDAANLLAGATFRALAPVLGAVDALADRAERFTRARRSRAALEAENRRLEAELAELRRERLRLAGLDREVERLARGLEYARASGLELRAAEVVYAERGGWLESLVVRVGAGGARHDQAVVAEEGVVGRVIEASGPWAKVQLVTDRAAAVAVELARARRQGIARGLGAELAVDYVPRTVAVGAGEPVVTAGIDGVYPRGLPVGLVVAVEPGSELFHAIRVRPAAALGELGIVYLVERGPEPPRAPAIGGRDSGADAGR
jgi:rod shape-determining protein MreC